LNDFWPLFQAIWVVILQIRNCSAVILCSITAPHPPLNPLASFRQRAYNNMVGPTSAFGSIFKSTNNPRLTRKNLPNFSFRINHRTADRDHERVDISLNKCKHLSQQSHHIFQYSKIAGFVFTKAHLNHYLDLSKQTILTTKIHRNKQIVGFLIFEVLLDS
jgi:hypothetical protein